MVTDEESEHVQIRLYSKEDRFVNAEAVFSIPSKSSTVQLCSVLVALLQSKELIQTDEENEFDFLIQGELLRTSLDEYMQQNFISTETVVDIEFIIKHPSPTPEQSVLHNDWVSCVQASSTYILSGCYDNTVKIHTINGKELLTLPAHSGPVRCLSWIQSVENVHSFVTGSHDQLLHVWQWEAQENSVKCLYKCKGHALSVESVAVSPDKLQFASVSRDMMLKIWTMDDRGVSFNTEDEAPKKKRKGHEVLTKVPIMTLTGHTEGIVGVSWREPGALITAGLDHTIRLWNLESQANTQTIKSSKALLAIDCSPISGKIITGSSDRHIRMWDSRITDASLVTGNFSSHTGWVSSVKWSQNNEYLFVSGSYDNLTKQWDIRSPKTPLYDLTGHTDKVMTVDWTNPAYVISGGADNSMNIFSNNVLC